MKNLISLLFCLLCLSVFSQEKKDINIKTVASEVTVFINGAQVTRKKTIDLNQGKSIIKFVGLSPYMDSKSIQLKANGNVMVLSVNHQFNYIDSASRSKELEDLSNKLYALNDKLDIETANIEIIKEEQLFLKDNRIIGGKNQEVSLNNLKETSNFYRERVSTLKLKELEINKKIENLNNEKTALNNQIKQISLNKRTPVSEVVVKVDAKGQTKCDMELSYFVDNVGWNPSYDLRVNSIDEPVDLVYKASIHQNTKEEWKNVKLKLSSSSPNLGSVAPRLLTYFLNYYTHPPRYKDFNNKVSGVVLEANTNNPIPGASIKIKGTTIGTISNLDGNYSLSIPNNSSELEVSFFGYESQTLPISSPTINVYLKESVQALEEVTVIGYGTVRNDDVSETLQGRVPGVSVKSKVKSNLPSSAPVPVEQVENQTSFEFEIKTPYTINSDNKSISVDIDNYSLNADYEYYCVPKIDKDAFLIANIVNWEKYNLLEGEANIFFENTFVGKSILDVRNVSDTLSISLGRDKNVMVKREKIKDFTTKHFFGSKKEETRAWQISVKNNKKQTINMILFDQVPVSTNNEIEVSVENISDALLNKDNGEVKWKFKLEPSAKKEFELKYKVKFPKERVLTVE